MFRFTILHVFVFAVVSTSTLLCNVHGSSLQMQNATNSAKAITSFLLSHFHLGFAPAALSTIRHPISIRMQGGRSQTRRSTVASVFAALITSRTSSASALAAYRQKMSSPKGPTTAPLVQIGLYFCTYLLFPQASYKFEGQTPSAKFLLDTGAERSTITPQLVRFFELRLARRFSNLRRIVGAEGDEVLVGRDIELGPFQFLEAQASASNASVGNSFRTEAVAIFPASPVGAGILGADFFNSLEGGVEFEWGDENTSVPGAVTFHSDRDSMLNTLRLKFKHKVSLLDDENVNVPSVLIKVNDYEVPAILDTGAPVSMINIPAASVAGLESTQIVTEEELQLIDRMKPYRLPWQSKRRPDREVGIETEEEAEVNGDKLTVAGVQGGELQLLRSIEKASVSIGGAKFDDAKFYIGDLSRWYEANMRGLSTPRKVAYSAVVGMDILRSRPRMLYRRDEVFF